MNSWIQVIARVPTRAEQVVLADAYLLKSEEEKAEPKKEVRIKEVNGSQNGSVPQIYEKSTEHVSFVQIVEHFLIDYSLEHKWNEKDEKYLTVEFYCPITLMDEIVDTFDQAGIGIKYNSSYRIIPCLFYESTQVPACLEAVDRKTKQESEPSDFLKTLKSRFAVQQVVDGSRMAGTINFDYSVFLLCAGLLAATGLVENSSVILVASMLVSPIMGPILAGTFGLSIRDKSLYKLGLKNEMISLASCLIIGFFFGLIYANIHSWHNGLFITEEMRSRGQLRSLGIGLLVALPSGVGVALSVLGNNVGSLVGVAISASLLPPMVNAGVLFSLSLVKSISGDLTLPASYRPVYSPWLNVEAACLASFSMCLTLLNILCIIVMGLLVLKVKQVVPKASNTLLKKFWTEDLAVVREQNARGERFDDIEHDPYKTIGLAQLFEEINDDPFCKTIYAAAYRNPHGKLSPNLEINRYSTSPIFFRRPVSRQSYDMFQDMLHHHRREDLVNDNEVMLRRPLATPPIGVSRKLLKRKNIVEDAQKRSSLDQRKNKRRFEVTSIQPDAEHLNP
ncbi:uncharacterized protein LOC136032262 isoform X2 [Artemia franciscana]|uniref:DUF389 domain-containing protein n=1 Tax=Artemia franciscana TaxID=6661 RepID=A0AA88IRT7_ARTSF|nr:hypothetical protein QYM36_000206 [Artemia franciscana]KAK2725624.1 hypothetical protein QYM36_000206 [Artemia franciscana]KAK2725627.1 hypothetical protein QYM36_000206 [Artemia franciscana]